MVRSRRGPATLNRRGVVVARCTVQPLMGELGLRGAIRRKVKRTAARRPDSTGGRNTSIRFGERLTDAGIRHRGRRRRLVCDNALAETINGLYETELIRPRGPWRTVEQVEVAAAEWVDWFNHRRLYEYDDDLPPAELEDAYHAQHRAQPAAELSHR